MLSRIAPLVSGHGEVAAFPVLLRRIISELSPELQIAVAPPVRCSESSLIKPDSTEFADYLAIAIDNAGQGGGVIVLIDSEDACPAEIGPQLLARARAHQPGIPLVVVCAYREYETWFLWSLDTYRDHGMVPGAINAPEAPESCRSAKDWLRRVAGIPYKEVVDQARFSARLDLQLARRSDSFDKLCRDVQLLLRAIRERNPGLIPPS